MSFKNRPLRYGKSMPYTSSRFAGRSKYGMAVQGARYAKVSANRVAKAIVSAGSGLVRSGGFYGRYASAMNSSGSGGYAGNELKFFDTALSFTTDATGEVPATGQLTLIPQGVTESTRVGRKCVIKSIQLRAILTKAESAINVTTVYIYVVLDKQANGAAAAVTDVVTSSNLAVGLINMANSERFVILKRIVVKCVPGAGATTAFGNWSQAVDYYKKCNIPVEFSSTTGAITEIKSNNIFLLAGEDSQGDDAITCIGNARLRFSDN